MSDLLEEERAVGDLARDVVADELRLGLVLVVLGSPRGGGGGAIAAQAGRQAGARVRSARRRGRDARPRAAVARPSRGKGGGVLLL